MKEMSCSDFSCQFEIGHKKYKGFKHFIGTLMFKRCDEQVTMYRRMESIFHGIDYVLAYKKRFPCFDSSDYIYENRYTTYYFLIPTFEEALHYYKALKKGDTEDLFDEKYEYIRRSPQGEEDESFEVYEKE